MGNHKDLYGVGGSSSSCHRLLGTWRALYLGEFGLLGLLGLLGFACLALVAWLGLACLAWLAWLGLLGFACLASLLWPGCPYDRLMIALQLPIRVLPRSAGGAG